MNTRKQVLIMSALLLLMLLSVAIYAAWYPTRAENAAEHFDELTAERGSILFARNCRLCHGDVAQGGLLGARLPAAPALDRPDLQGFIDLTATLSADVSPTATSIRVNDASKFRDDQVILIDEERMQVTGFNGSELSVARGVGHSEAGGHLSGAPISGLDPAALDDKVDLITNTITCGRVGTAMPAWAQEHGGPLSEEQIRQLMTLITQARWNLVEHEVDIEDLIAASLAEPLSASATSMRVSDVTVFTVDEALRLGEERVRVVSIQSLPLDAAGNTPRDKSGAVAIERGVLNTVAEEHGPETVIYRFPEVAEPSILQNSCGQTAQPAAPPGTPETIEPFQGTTVQLVAQNLAFDIREIRVDANANVRLRLDNRDTAVNHNIAVRRSATDPAEAFPGSIGTTFPGPGIDDTVFQATTAGNYLFRCDVHPTTMTGTFIVQ
ncbi:MAG: hypothetical protein GEU75_04335 [Dehalococcoidia bacterium]|nr:hypothetical protein [Dehalococcoidia bacterium]